MRSDISGLTGLTCLLGHPVSHSISPAMHNSAFSLLHLDYAYLAFDVTEDQLPAAVAGLRAINAKGWNLTMPLKTAIIPYLDELSEAAALSNSVNTVVNDNGRLIGHTTDGAGYMDSVRDAGFDIIGKSMVLLGAGGAATSICSQAALDGVSTIYMFKRKNATYASAQAFADLVTGRTHCKVILQDMNDADALASAIAKSDILVNATNVGMGDSHDTLVPKEMLRPELIVSDIIYHPAMTPLLRDAAQVGCPYFNGKYMLLFQGARSFRLWTGEDMPTEQIKSMLF